MDLDGYDGKAQQDGPPDFRRIVGMDPAADWLLGTAAPDFLIRGEETEIPFLLVFDESAAAEAFWSLVDAVADEARIRVAIMSRRAELRGSCDPVAAVAKRAFFERLAGGDERFFSFAAARKSITLSDPAYLALLKDGPPDDARGGGDTPRPERGESRVPTRRSSADADRQDAPDCRVVMAVIDDGIAFAHARLRTSAGTRVAHFWNMNLWSGFGPISPGKISGELDRAEIDGLLGGSVRGGAIDEDEVYRKAGLVDFRDPRHKAAALRVAHGAHVTDLAAGYDPDEEMDARPVIAVQLPTLAVERTVGKLLDTYIFLAVWFALARAKQMAGGGQALPLVINTSFGYVAGAHDGKAPLERALDAVIAAHEGRVQIVLPAGNAQLSRCHAEIDLTCNEKVEFDWIVQPDDRTVSVVEVWLPASEDPHADPFERIEMRVTQPDGTETAIAETLFAAKDIEHRSRWVGRMSLVQRGFDGRRMLRLQILPTARPEPDPRALAPAGRWQLAFSRGKEPLEGSAHAWSERDDRLYGYPQRGRQAYFDHATYQRHDARGFVVADDPAAPKGPVRRASLLNSFASGAGVITAGGYSEDDGRVADYSAGGPNTPAEADGRRKPDVLLPSDGSRVLYGVLAAGARSAGRVALDGTSVAAPQLARHIAERLAAGKPAHRAAMQGVADASTIGVIGDFPEPPERSGWGRLARSDTLRSVRR